MKKYFSWTQKSHCLMSHKHKSCESHMTSHVTHYNNPCESNVTPHVPVQKQDKTGWCWVCWRSQVESIDPVWDKGDEEEGLWARGCGNEWARGTGWAWGNVCALVWVKGKECGAGGSLDGTGSFSFSLSQVSPKALAKWSSTDPGADPSVVSFLAFKADHVLSPRARAKWSSTDPESSGQKISQNNCSRCWETVH